MGALKVKKAGTFQNVGGSSKKVRKYARSGSYLYAGVAPEGYTTANTGWKITRIQVGANTASLVGTKVATNVKWDDRATASYV